NESRLSLSAALHAAFSCPNTRFLDLDGDLDLVRDPAKGGYQIKNGMMTIDDTPGLGVTLNLT
ncbi:MAG TPA: enolase C-terminal domain-like protein, partial [SAR324 cluster bacterium]|nr:enolase C-terminal domain-like protein [SAR324 cluster bacterium]